MTKQVHRAVKGKEELFIYLTKAVYKSVRMEAVQQGVSVSKFIEACLVLQMVSPPLVGTKMPKCGKPRKIPRVPFVEPEPPPVESAEPEGENESEE
jgi:hypothetical protein